MTNDNKQAEAQQEGVRVIVDCLNGSSFTDANGDGDLTVYADEVEPLAREIFRRVWMAGEGQS